MNNNQNEEEVYILVDENGNEIQEENEKENEEVDMEESYELEDDSVSYDEDDEEYDDEDGDGGFFGSVSNKLLAIFGGVIAVAAICVGIFFITSRAGGSNVDFSNVGSTVAEIGVIGGTNIRAIAAAKGAYIDDINEAIKSYDYTEADLEGGITTVDITLTSIVKDLKIKFVNASGKLIASVPFEVEVTDPSGKTTTWTDTDKDGIIYQSDIAGGSYTVKLVPMSGYDALYDFSNSKSAKSVSVKTQLDYQKVDVKNEIKIQNSSNQAEDAALKETVVESKLKDTVAYVMSNKTATSGYTVIDKSTIANPIEALTKSYEAAIGRFKRLSGPVNVDEHEHVYGDTWIADDDTYCSCSCTVDGCTDKKQEAHDYVDGTCTRCGHEKPVHSHSFPETGWTKLDDNQCEVKCEGCEETEKRDHEWGADGKCTRCGAENPTVPHSHNYGTPTWSGTSDAWKHTLTCANTDNKCEVLTIDENCTKVYTQNSDGKTHTVKCSECNHEEANIACKDSGNGKCVCGRDMKAPAFAPTITIASVPAINRNAEGKATVSITDNPNAYTPTYAWEIKTKDSKIVSLTDVDKETVKIKGLAAGTETLICTVKFNDANKTEVKKEVTVTVNSISITLDRTAKKVVYVGGDTFAVKAVTKGGAKNTVTWSCSDTSIATITTSESANATEGTNTVTVKGLKPGKVTLTATSTEDTGISASIEIVVATHPKDDKSTKLTDKSGKQVYVYDSASKSYREAVYADYYTGVDLYTPCDVVYTYTGWWTIDGKSYYFDSNGKKVTGDQVILGAKYSFDSNGVLKSGTGTFGIDVSTFNGTIDWNKVAKSGVNFAIIRCGLRGSTAGALYEDSKFATNIKNATAAGVKVGLYFFTQAVTEAEAVEEASMALTMAEGYKISYPIFIDVESATNGRANGLSKADRTKIINAFCKTISNGGYKAGIYANKTWYTNNMDVSQLTSYTIWLAQYASAPTYTASRYDVWQYSSEGSLNGISGNVDLDLSYLGY